jgi:peptidoglycan/xylan/chitin deacetylase (PgdA/CDA1 family)
MKIDIEKTMERILLFLDESDIKATFFVLGTFAEEYPEIIKKLKRADHEIGSHFYSHSNLYELNEKEIELGIKKSRKILGNLKGFRAPMYTMDMRTIRILEKNGFEYDSSVFPSVIYPHPSVRKIEKNLRIRVLKKSGPYNVDGITEIPLTVFPSYMGVPVTGTSIRLYGKIIAKLIPFFRGEVFVMNMHPFEFVENVPKPDGAPFWFSRNVGEKFGANLMSIINSLKNHGAEFSLMGDLI